MDFFDLNVPYRGGGGQMELEAQKNARLKIVVKAMELGYGGVAYNQSIRGTVTNSDKCSIHRFPLSSLLKFAPPLSASVKFHRNLLGVSPNTPFRQYTRLTVSVDNIIDAAALTSGKTALRTYDLIAVMPLNQSAFDLACKVSEVDLIAIDFSRSLPFRLKLPMINAAIERGIYFEITYSHLIADVEIRRQMLSGAKMLVEWTRGKNIIFSSAATSADELRGPNDVANLSVLLGLSMEKAKAAISKNCRSVLVSSLRKKQYYREAIKVERVIDGEPLLSKSWDPISSGDGDISLDDIAKSFSDSRKVPSSVNMCGKAFQSSNVTSCKSSVKELVSAGHPEETPSTSDLFDGYQEAIKVERVIDGEPLLSKSWDPSSSGDGDISLDDVAKDVSDSGEVPSSVNWFSKSFKSSDVTSYKFSLKELLSAGHPEETPSSSDLYDGIMSVKAAALKDQTNDAVASKDQTGDPAVRTTSATGLDSSCGFDVVVNEKPSSGCSKDQTSEAKKLDSNLSTAGLVRIAGSSLSPIAGATQPDATLSNICASNGEVGVTMGKENVTLTAYATSHSEACLEDTSRLDGLHAVIDTCDKPMEQLLENLQGEEQHNAIMACDEYIVKNRVEIFKEGATTGLSTDECKNFSSFKGFCMKMNEEKRDCPGTPGVTVEGFQMQKQEKEEVIGGGNKFIEIKNKSGKNKRKRKSRQPVCPLPFKGLPISGASSKKRRRKLLK